MADSPPHPPIIDFSVGDGRRRPPPSPMNPRVSEILTQVEVEVEAMEPTTTTVEPTVEDVLANSEQALLELTEDDFEGAEQLSLETRVEECRKLIVNGIHPQLMSKFKRNKDTGEVIPGNKMSLFVPKSSSKNSKLDEFGVRCNVTLKNSNDGQERLLTYWFCQHANCVLGLPPGHSKSCISIGGSTTTNGTKHLLNKHRMMTDKTRARNANADAFKQVITDANPGFRTDPSRFFANCFAIAASEHAIPFSMFRGTAWNLAMHHMTISGVPEHLRNYDIRKPIIEQYHAMKSRMRAEIADIKSWYGGVACFCLILDMYKNPVSKTKFACFRLTGTCPKTGGVVQYNLGCLEYNPSLEQRKEERASTLLYKFTLILLGEFGLTPEDIMTGSCDFGPDVRKCVKMIATLQEWCLGHMEVRAMVSAHGHSQDASDSKHPEMRQFISKVRKMAESLNKSGQLLQCLQELTKLSVPVRMACTSRWTSVINTFQDLLLHEVDLKTAYDRCQKTYPLDDDDETIICETYNVLLDAKKVQLESQKTKEQAQTSAFLKLVDQYNNLKRSTEVNIVIPKRKKLNDQLMNTCPVIESVLTRSHWDMFPIVQDVRTKARQALDGRYFWRYHPWHSLKKPTRFLGRNSAGIPSFDDLRYSYVYEMGVLLNPRLGEKVINKCFGLVQIGSMPQIKRGEFLDDSANVDVPRLRSWHTKCIIRALWDFIVEQVTEYYKQNPPPSVEDDRQNKRRKIEQRSTFLMFDEEMEVSSSSSDDDEDTAGFSPAQSAKREVEYFRSFCKVDDSLKKIDSYKSKDSITYWFVEPKVMSKWPGLTRVALSLLGMAPGSGGLECDIGGLGDIVSTKRGSLSPGMVEAMMMVRLNKKLQEWDTNKTPNLDSKWPSKIPKREWILDEVGEDWLNGGMNDDYEEEPNIDGDHDELDV